MGLVVGRLLCEIRVFIRAIRVRARDLYLGSHAS